MITLKQLQEEFQHYLKGNKSEQFRAHIEGNSTDFIDKRLDVYYDAYRLRLAEVLQIDYPKLEKILGCQAFFQCALEFIDQYPSSHFSVRPFGQPFETFLKETKPYNTYPYMHELANFEWSLMASLDSANAPIADVSQLQQTPPDDWGYLCFAFHPSVHTRTYHWDTPALWKDLENDNPPRKPMELEAPQAWVFWRKGLKSKYESMSEPQQVLYKGICQKLTVAELAHMLSESFAPEQVPMLLVQNLQYWLEQGLLSQFEAD